MKNALEENEFVSVFWGHCYCLHLHHYVFVSNFKNHSVCRQEHCCIVPAYCQRHDNRYWHSISLTEIIIWYDMQYFDIYIYASYNLTFVIYIILYCTCSVWGHLIWNFKINIERYKFDKSSWNLIHKYITDFQFSDFSECMSFHYRCFNQMTLKTRGD